MIELRVAADAGDGRSVAPWTSRPGCATWWHGRLGRYAAREGTRDGQYPAGSIAAFGADIAAAQAVLDATRPPRRGYARR